MLVTFLGMLIVLVKQKLSELLFASKKAMVRRQTVFFAEVRGEGLKVEAS